MPAQQPVPNWPTSATPRPQRCPAGQLQRIVLLCLLLLSGCDRSDPAVPAQPPGPVPPVDSLKESTAASVDSVSKLETEMLHDEHQHAVQLVDISPLSNIDFVHHYDGKGEMLIVEPVASGLATLDFDVDGRLDVYFLNGSPVPADLAQTKPNALFRNLGEMRFANATAHSATDDTGYSLGVAVADFDGDGFSDLFVNNFGPNKLYRNNGDGTFTDATEMAGVQCGPELGAGACFLDIDADGLLDLYVGNYVKKPVEANIKRTTDGFASYPGPLDFEPEFDYLFRNLGDGTFADHSQASGIAQIATTSMGTIAGDFDEDGDSDIIVVNDVERNLFFQNDGSGKFEEIGILAGIAFSHDAQRNGNMGIDSADYDHDGAFDLFTTTFSNDLPVLYHNDGVGNFQDVTLASGAGKGLLPHANWGTAFMDVDNDGDKDLLIANGHTDPNVNQWAYTTDWKVANTLMLNTGDGRFANISTTCGTGLTPVESSRGVVVDDFDNDGDVDAIILNALAAPPLSAMTPAARQLVAA